MTAEATPKVKFRRVLQNQLQLAEHARLEYRVSPEEGVTIEDLLRAETWAHVTKSLKAGTLIDAVANDGSWYARLFVRSVKDLDVSIALLERHDFDAVAAPAEDEFTFKWAGPSAKFRIIRNSDKAVMAEGLESKGACAEWLKTPKAA